MKHSAFTLIEVLITLGIIGVVAAITLPVLVNKIKNNEYDRARARALNTIGEAGRLLAIQGDIVGASNSEDFVKNYLSKKLKIVKYCDSANLQACGLSSDIKTVDGSSTVSMPTKFSELQNYSEYSSSGFYTIRNNSSYGFVTADGYSVNLFYNPNCTTDTNYAKEINYDALNFVCFNAIYDMNGLRNPNQIGKDIGFVTLLYPDETNRAVAPNPSEKPVSGVKNYTNAQIACRNLGREYTLPDKEEIISMSVNENLIGEYIGTDGYMSSTYRDNFIWRLAIGSGKGGWYRPNTTHRVKCVKR